MAWKAMRVRYWSRGERLWGRFEIEAKGQGTQYPVQSSPAWTVHFKKQQKKNKQETIGVPPGGVRGPWVLFVSWFAPALTHTGHVAQLSTVLFFFPLCVSVASWRRRSLDSDARRGHQLQSKQLKNYFCSLLIHLWGWNRIETKIPTNKTDFLFLNSALTWC